MAELTETEIICLSSTERNRQWVPSSELGKASLNVLNVPSIVMGKEETLYFPSRLVSRAVRSTTAEVIFVDGWHSPTFIQAIILARRSGKGVVLSYRSTLTTHRFTRGMIPWIRRSIFSSVDAVLVAGNRSAEAVLAMGIPRSKIVQGFYNVVDVDYFRQEVDRARIGLPSFHGHQLLYVGQLIGRKNLEAALRAWATIRGKDDRFSIVGDGPLRERLIRTVRDLRIEDSVCFLGHRSGEALIAEYAKAQTLVLPSTKEVWGLVANEALAAGLHVVVSDTTGVAEEIQKHSGVYLASPDIDTLASALKASRRDWTGPIEQPAMLGHSPSKAALAVLQAADVACRNRARSWKR